MGQTLEAGPRAFGLGEEMHRVAEQGNAAPTSTSLMRGSRSRIKATPSP